MALKPEIINLEKDAPINIWELEEQIISFDNKIMAKNRHSAITARKLQDCILHFRTARNIMRSYIDPMTNDKIINEQDLKLMDDNIGRIDKNLDALSKEAVTKLGNTEFLKVDEVLNIKIQSFRIFLIEAMETIVERALIKAVNNFKQLDDDKKNEKNFYLLIYREMFLASQSVGGSTRQEMASFPRGLAPHRGSSSNKNTTPSSEDSEDEEEEPEEVEETLFPEDSFKDDEIEEEAY